jgi:hypothetical protein
MKSLYMTFLFLFTSNAFALGPQARLDMIGLKEGKYLNLSKMVSCPELEITFVRLKDQVTVMNGAHALFTHIGKTNESYHDGDCYYDIKNSYAKGNLDQIFTMKCSNGPKIVHYKELKVKDNIVTYIKSVTKNGESVKTINCRYRK